MHTQNNLTAPHTALRAGLYMVQSGHSVVAISIISINGFYHGRSLHHISINNHELLLAIYVQGKTILRKSCIHKKPEE